MIHFRKLIYFFFLCVLLVGCLGNQERVVTVFAASSLTDAVEALAQEYRLNHPDVEIRLNFAASSTLAVQIIEGAQADLYASANPIQMQRVVDAGLAEGETHTFARNTLVAVAHAESGVNPPFDFAKPEVRLVTVIEGVPIREYTDEILDALVDHPIYGADYVAAVRANFASEEPNVRQAVAKVQLGEADGAFVYRSDTVGEARESLVVADLPPQFEGIARYPIVRLTRSKAAQDFLEFVLSEEGQTILNSYAFQPY